MKAQHSKSSKCLRKDGRLGIGKAEIKHVSFSVSFIPMEQMRGVALHGSC